MVAFIIICRSITYAQRLQKMLSQAGFQGVVRRIPAISPGDGCGYGVRLPSNKMREVLNHLKTTDYTPQRIVCETEKGKLEECS